MAGNSCQVGVANHILCSDRRVPKNSAIVFTRCSCRGSVCETEQTPRENVQLIIRSSENAAEKEFLKL